MLAIVPLARKEENHQLSGRIYRSVTAVSSLNRNWCVNRIVTIRLTDLLPCDSSDDTCAGRRTRSIAPEPGLVVSHPVWPRAPRAGRRQGNTPVAGAWSGVLD